jgi:hypothetical protein
METHGVQGTLLPQPTQQHGINCNFTQFQATPVYEDNTACIERGNHIIG